MLVSQIVAGANANLVLFSRIGWSKKSRLLCYFSNYFHIRDAGFCNHGLEGSPERLSDRWRGRLGGGYGGRGLLIQVLIRSQVKEADGGGGSSGGEVVIRYLFDLSKIPYTVK